eukprot:365083-Chlamydomonas_euryale.AAC.18
MVMFLTAAGSIDIAMLWLAQCARVHIQGREPEELLADWQSQLQRGLQCEARVRSFAVRRGCTHVVLDVDQSGAAALLESLVKQVRRRGVDVVGCVGSGDEEWLDVWGMSRSGDEGAIGRGEYWLDAVCTSLTRRAHGAHCSVTVSVTITVAPTFPDTLTHTLHATHSQLLQRALLSMSRHNSTGVPGYLSISWSKPAQSRDPASTTRLEGTPAQPCKPHGMSTSPVLPIPRNPKKSCDMMSCSLH